jgi:hypothetical protein
MSGPSFVRSSSIVAVLLVAACRHHPEADPAKVVTLAGKIIFNEPVPAAARPCVPGDVMGGATLTWRTLMQIAKRPIPNDATLADWINPAELDAPAAITLADDKASTTDRRRAAAELLAAPFYLIYKVDSVDAPMALGIKETKRGTVGARAIRYDKKGGLVCIQVFMWQNGAAKSDWAIEKNKMIVMDPAIEQALRDDLRARMLERVASLAATEVAPVVVTPTKEKGGGNDDD